MAFAANRLREHQVALESISVLQIGSSQGIASTEHVRPHLLDQLGPRLASTQPLVDAVGANVVEAVLAELFVGEHAAEVLLERVGADVAGLLLEQVLELQLPPDELQVLLLLFLGVELLLEQGLELVEEDQIAVLHIGVHQQVVLGQHSFDHLVLIPLFNRNNLVLLLLAQPNLLGESSLGLPLHERRLLLHYH